MNREEILRMAREAGIKNYSHGIWCNADQLERFAKLITVHLLPSMTWQEGYEAGVVAEREACAKIADGQLLNTNALLVHPMQSSAAYEIGCAIRERSNND